MNARQLAVKILQKTRLNKLAHKLYYGYVHGFDTANPAVLDAQKQSFDKAVETGVARNGDYMEFGLFKGYSFWHAQDVARRLGLDGMRFFGFDSFAGLPPVDGVDRTDDDVFYEGQYACSKEQVTKNLDSKGVDWERTFLIEGYYEDSLVERLKERHDMRHAAVALIDCDLYESTRQVLDFLDDLVRDGSVLMMDDWNCFDADDDRGQRLAMREFLARHPGWRLEDLAPYGTWGHVFVLRTGD